MLLLQNDKLK